MEAMGRALDAVTASDARGFFEHRGYHAPAQLLRQRLQDPLISDQRTTLKLKMGFWSAPKSCNQIGISISVPRAVEMSPRSIMSVQPMLHSSSLTVPLASASSPHTNTVCSPPAS